MEESATPWEQTLLDDEIMGTRLATPREEESNKAKRSIRYLAGMALKYGHVKGIGDLLDRVAAFRQYKPYNALLVLLQRPMASFVLPAHEWSGKYGYAIRPDEQPLVMLQPRGPVMFLFDVSQTEPGPQARPLPRELRNPYGMNDVLTAASYLDQLIQNAKQDGVRVLPTGLGLGYAGCVQRTKATVAQAVRPSPTKPPVDVRVGYDVLLNRSYSPTEQLATLAHELGHLYCGHLGSVRCDLIEEEVARSRDHMDIAWRELEAESVARVVFRRLAPQSELPRHLHQYFSREPELGEVDLEPILTAAGRILEMAQGTFVQRRRSTTRLQVRRDA